MVSERLKGVILSQLKLKDFAIEDSMAAADVPGWDSLNHVRILAAIEREFQIRFRSVEAVRVRNVGDLQALIESKCASPGAGARRAS